MFCFVTAFSFVITSEARDLFLADGKRSSRCQREQIPPFGRDDKRQRNAASARGTTSSPIIKPELHRDIVSVVPRRQRAESIDSLQRPHRRLIERRNAARLLDPDVDRLSGASDLKIYVNPSARRLSRGSTSYFSQFSDTFAAHDIDIPPEAAAKISVAALETEPAFGSARGERTIRAADRAALAERNLLSSSAFATSFGGGFFCVDSRFWFFRLASRVGNRNRLRLFLWTLPWAATASALWIRWPARSRLGVCGAGRGMLLTSVALIAPPPPSVPPQLSPRPLGIRYPNSAKAE